MIRLKFRLPDDQQHRNHRHAHRNFIGNHLRARPDAAEHRIFRVRRVARQHDAINAERHDAEGVEDADVQIRDDHFLVADLRAERNHRHDQHRGNHRDGRREPEINLPHARRREILLEHEFQAVRQRLENAEPDQAGPTTGIYLAERRRAAVRPDAVLNPCRNFALGQHRVSHHALHHADDDGDFDETEDDEIPVHV